MNTPVHSIVIFGPESTGKTTLARSLAAHFGEPWSQEYVREYWDSHGGRVTAADLADIARGQIAGEEDARAKAAKFAFHDTDLLTCTLWDDLLFPGACPAWVRETMEERVRKVSLFLLCNTDVPFEPDPQRCFPDEEGRAMSMRLWRESLTSRNLPYLDITGPWDERLQKAIRDVGAITKNPP